MFMAIRASGSANPVRVVDAGSPFRQTQRLDFLRSRGHHCLPWSVVAVSRVGDLDSDRGSRIGIRDSGLRITD